MGPAGEILDQWTISAAPVLFDPPVLDAATFGSRVAPGALVSLFGWNLAPAEGATGAARAFVNGSPSPLVYASRLQLNAQLPLDVTGAAELEVRSAAGSARKTFTVDSVAPAIFQVPDGLARVAAAVHLNGQLVTRSSPAKPGEWLAVYLTGLGAVRGGILAGQPAPGAPLYETLAPVRAQLGGADAEVSIACLAPGFFGLYQVNLRVPLNTGSGVQQLRISASGFASAPADLPVSAP